MLIFIWWSFPVLPSADSRALFILGLSAAVFLVTISYSVITSWGLLWRLGLQCREYSRLKWWDCHGDRLPSVRSCIVLGIYNPQTCLWAGQCSYQGRFWKSFSRSFEGQWCLGNPALGSSLGRSLALPQMPAAFVPACCCFVLLGLTAAAKNNPDCLTFRI